MRRLPKLLTPLALAVAPASAQAEAVPLDTTPRVAIVSAFEPEWIALQQGIEAKREWSANGVRFVGGRMGGKQVLLFLSGVSMTNAAMTTQLALDRFRITSIVFSGVAGGIDPSLDVGDVVVPDRWGQYLESIFVRQDGEKYLPPEGVMDAKPLPNYGMIFPRSVMVRRDGLERPERRFWFEADPVLLGVARQVAATQKLERCRDTLCLVAQPKVVVGGSGISGPVFMDNADFRKYAFRAFQATVTDMETAAVGQVAFANQVPYIAFRSLSDLAGGDPGPNQAKAFYRLASDNSAAVVRAFVAAMPCPGGARRC